MAGTNVPSLHSFLEILSRFGHEYYSDETGDFLLSRECFFVGDGTLQLTLPELMPLDLSPTSCIAYLKDKEEPPGPIGRP